MVSKLLILAHILAAVSAQSGSPTITSSPSTAEASGTAKASETAKSESSRAPRVHTIAAGSGGFKFTPNKLTNVSVGDTVTFEFYPPDHSVARAAFMSPCVPYEDTAPGRVGFWSEVQWVNTVNDLTQFNITVNTTEPIFFYCAAKGSCKDQQMIGVINPNATWSLETQRAFAKNSTLELAPGDPIPAEATATLTHPATQPTAAATAATAASTNTNNDPKQENNKSGLSGGVIAGIVVGAIAFLAICAALFFYVGRTKSLKEVLDHNATVAKTAPAPPSTPGFSDYGSPLPSPMPHGYPSPMMSNGMPSPQMQQSDFYQPVNSQLPPYQQHNVAEQYPSGWGSPPPQHPALVPVPHMSEAEKKPQRTEVSELGVPGAEEPKFTAELEAPLKSPRG